MGKLYVVIRLDSELERIHQIDTAEELIGRSMECRIVLPHKLVSRRHATILKRGDCFVVRDEQSCNGTFVNGNMISQDEVLDDEAEVKIGPYSLTICHSVGVALKHAAVISDEATPAIIEFAPDPVAKNGRANGRLTVAQYRVYELFLEGLSEKQAAVQLGISVNTVHEHAKAIYKKLSVSTRSELLSLRIRQSDLE